MPSLSRQINHNDNDYRRAGITYQNCGAGVCPAVLRAGSTAVVGTYTGAGLCFTLITIPQGSTILRAYLTITCLTARSEACKTRISAEDVDNPTPFKDDDATAAITRWNNRTTARVDWDFTTADPWVSNTQYNSPEIKTIVQEIVNRAGWESGNSIVIFWNDWDMRSTDGGNDYRCGYPHNVDSDKAAKLFIEYGGSGVSGYDKAYPTDATMRVTSIIHRYDRGVYNMELLLGDVISDFGIPETDTLARKTYESKEEKAQYPPSPTEPTPAPEPTPTPIPIPSPVPEPPKVAPTTTPVVYPYGTSPPDGGSAFIPTGRQVVSEPTGYPYVSPAEIARYKYLTQELAAMKARRAQYAGSSEYELFMKLLNEKNAIAAKIGPRKELYGL